MLAYSRATRSPGVAALAAIVMFAAPASAQSQQRARSRTAGSTAPAVAVPQVRYRRRRRARGCANATTRAGSASRPAIRNAVLCLVNQQRAAHGLPRLRGSADLTRSAQGWSDEMLASRTFSHGSDFAARIADAGYRWSVVGENIATGFSTARAVVRAWMASTGHCQNILNPSYRSLGVGITRDSMRGARRGAAIWTQDFGLHAAQSARSNNWGPADGCPY
jgi:uncharacterized protein YkwD